MPNTFATVAALIVACALSLTLPSPARSTSSPIVGMTEGRLTEAARLSAIYDTILDARFDEARTDLAQACPPAPMAACHALREVALWWEIQQDLSSRRLDRQLETAAATAIASASGWTEREPQSAEAWFYLAGAYAPLSQWRVLRGERLAAAREGKRIKESLERALSLDGALADAWFGIGLYHYYADVAPAAVKVLRFLLLLPGGDRVQGLQEMLRARNQGELLRSEADYQLHWLYLWYEEQPLRALELLRGLDVQHPSNPLFLARIASVEHEYFSDHRASADNWRSLLDRASTARVAFARMTEARARVGLAAELVELAQAGQAIDLLIPVVGARPSEPYGVLALAQLTLGDAYALTGERSRALEMYSLAIESAPRDDPDAIRTRARNASARTRSAR